MAKIADCFGYKTTWFAIQGADINAILQCCPNLINRKRTTWKDGLEEVENSLSKVFLSGTYEGWTFIVGLGLYEPSQPEDITNLLLKFGQIAEEVCYFSSHRTVSSYGFARVVRGKIERLYCYVGDEGHIYKTKGERTEAERALSLNLALKDEDLFEDGFDEIDEENIFELAGQWSLDPQLLIGEEEQESIIADIT